MYSLGGESLHWPSKPRSRNPGLTSAHSNYLSIDRILGRRADVQHVSIHFVHDGARIAQQQLYPTRLYRLAPGCLHPCRTDCYQTTPATRVQSSPGQASRRCASSRLSSCISRGDPSAFCTKVSNSSRYSSLRLLRNRYTTATRFTASKTTLDHCACAPERTRVLVH